ncbi:MAG: hypothetical protein ACFWT2_09245 [Thermoanaerobacterium thermosaccharolyticum]
MLNVELKKSDVLNLDDDIDKAIDKMKSIDEIYKNLPGLDCRSERYICCINYAVYSKEV